MSRTAPSTLPHYLSLIRLDDRGEFDFEQDSFGDEPGDVVGRVGGTLWREDFAMCSYCVPPVAVGVKEKSSSKDVSSLRAELCRRFEGATESLDGLTVGVAREENTVGPEGCGSADRNVVVVPDGTGVAGGQLEWSAVCNPLSFHGFASCEVVGRARSVIAEWAAFRLPRWRLWRVEGRQGLAPC